MIEAVLIFYKNYYFSIVVHSFSADLGKCDVWTYRSDATSQQLDTSERIPSQKKSSYI